MELVNDLNSAIIFSFWARLMLEDWKDANRVEEGELEMDGWTDSGTHHLDKPGQLCSWMLVVNKETDIEWRRLNCAPHSNRATVTITISFPLHGSFLQMWKTQERQSTRMHGPSLLKSKCHTSMQHEPSLPMEATSI